MTMIEAEVAEAPLVIEGSEMQAAAADDARKAEEARATEREALVTRMSTEVREQRDALANGAFKRMRDDMAFVANRKAEQWSSGDLPGDPDKYVANITHRHVQQKTDNLYAKNPQFVVKRKPRLDFAIWDGKPESLQSVMTMFQGAQMAAQAAGAMGMAMQPQLPPEAMALIADVKQGMERRAMLDRMGRTGEALFKYFMEEQRPRAKTQFKQAVRRAITCAVSYVRLDYQRVTGPNPVLQTRIADSQQQVEHLNALMKEAAERGDGEACEGHKAQKAEMDAMIADFQSKPDLIFREGPVLDFPASTSVIFSKSTRALVGWIGTTWLAVETIIPVKRVEEIFGVDLKKDDFTAYSPTGKAMASGGSGSTEKEEQLACVWVRYDQASGLEYWLCDGYKKFLREPAAPNVKVEGFFPIWPLVFNEIESEDDPVPNSDVRLMVHQAREHNRSQEALRQHRRANAPFSVAAKGAFSPEDVDKIKTRAPHEVVELDEMAEGGKISDKVQAWPTAPLDPALYDSTPVLRDTQLVVGSQQAQMGATSDSTATEASIAAESSAKGASSNTDDLDDLLTEVGRAMFSVMLQEMDAGYVKELVGPGAVWPEMAREDIEKEIYMEVLAGSSGRPNQAQEIAQLERATPLLLQTPGVNPAWIARKVVQTIDRAADLEDALLDGVPSLSAINALMQTPAAPAGPAGNAPPGAPPPSGPEDDPAAQGGEGAQNAPTMERPGGPQPAFPTGAPMGQ